MEEQRASQSATPKAVQAAARAASGCTDAERLTAARAGNTRTDADRLAAYDTFAAEVRAESAQVQARMDELRAAGKVKTATYRQLFASRITLKEIVSRLEAHGL